ncbi:MAG: deoxyguanosinetriphosphate triphosphohydrolase, partial [Burkholderiaceae bacterium]
RRFLAHQQPSLEAQLCNLADEIAYNAHDIDDGVRSGLLTLDQLRDIPLFDRYRAEALAEYPELDTPQGRRRLLYDAIRRMLSAQVYDVINTTQAALAQAMPSSVDEVRSLRALVGFGDAMRAQSQELKHFLLHRLYRHEQVARTMGHARQVVRELFGAYLACPQEMKPSFCELSSAAATPQDRARVVADFIAGMTDRYAAREHERLTGQRLLC